jgi:hypothetical protein
MGKIQGSQICSIALLFEQQEAEHGGVILASYPHNQATDEPKVGVSPTSTKYFGAFYCAAKDLGK